MINYKKILSFVSAVALIVPISGMVDSSQLGDINVFAEDTTTDDTSTSDTELVNGEVPSPIEDFKFNADTGTITGYTGLDTEVVIPKSINGVPVRIIGTNAFKQNKTVIKVTIPNTVVTISGGTGDMGVTLYGAFNTATALKEVVFEDGSNLTTILQGAFYNCANLQEITIPSNVSLIDRYTFDGCTSLKKIDFGNVTSIGEKAFSGCTSLTEVEIPSTVQTIGGYAFEGCSGLTNITLNEGLISINDCAFIDCPSIVEMVIPNSVKKIGNTAFSASWGMYYSGIKSLTLPEDVVIGDYAFAGSKIQTLDIKDGTAIGDGAFYSCGNLSEITVTGNVSIGRESFKNCSGLTKATFSKETTIGFDAIGSMLTSSLIDPSYETGLTIYGYRNTNAEKFAIENNINFVDLEAEETITTQETPKGDLDGDGKVNIMDLLKLKKYILGIIDTLN